mgnify:CR=1 FL=1
MLLRTLLAVALAAAFASPAKAFIKFGPSETSAVVGSLVLVSPFIVVYSGAVESKKASVTAVDASQRWTVETVRPEGDKTALELRSDDRKMKIAMAMDTRLAQREQVRVGDRIDLEAVGETGYTVKKGEVTIALLTNPETGMTYSKART